MKTYSSKDRIRIAPNGVITSKFGERIDPVSRSISIHNGVDIAMKVGSDIFAPSNGTVMAVFKHYAGGITVIIKDTDDYNLRYGMCHLSKALVVVGQKISRGELIAKSGNTGRSTGPHLHFSVKCDGEWRDDGTYIGGKWTDPLGYIECDEK